MQRYALKLVLIGDSRVGKSQLSRAFVNKSFMDDAQVTVGIEFSTKVIEFEKCLVQTHIWDTAGQERLQSMTKAYFKNTAGAVLVYDVCDRKTFENLRNIWLKQLREQGYTDARLILVGNKVDLLGQGKDREVPVSEAMDFARQENMDFFETSALTSYCVDHMFRRISLSIARVLPEVMVHLEVSYLPDGWFAVVDDSPGAENSASDISISDVTAAMSDGPVNVSASPGGGKKLSLASSAERTKSPLAAEVPRMKYINYWTGEVQRERPTSPAPLSDGILYVAREASSGADVDPFTGKPIDRALLMKERTSSCKTTATFLSSSSAGRASSISMDQPNYDLHESRRSKSLSSGGSRKASLEDGQGSIMRCLRATCTIA